MSQQPNRPTPPPGSVQLGSQTLQVYPQRIGYLRNRIEKAVATVQGVDLGDGSLHAFLAAGPEAVHPFLGIFFPGLMPLWQFAGFGSEDEYKRSLPKVVINGETGDPQVDDDGNVLYSPGDDTYDENRDESPDPAQLLVAFEAAVKANRIDLAKGLGEWLPFDMAKEWIRVKAAVWLDDEKATARRQIQSPTTPSSSDS